VQLHEPVSPLSRWSLDPTVVHLNHGSYGGCPLDVTAAAAAWRTKLEAAPMRFMVLDWQPALDYARAQLADFLHAPADRLVFLPSSTTGVAIALNSATLGPGDDILTTDHAYRACMNQLKRLAAARGATISVVTVPVPFDPDAMIDAVTRALTPRTRLALFDHIISPTAVVLPIAPLIALCNARGIQTVIDGAHAPGQIPLDVAAIGATWYIGNCHKWLCAPKGSGFLAVAPGAPAHPVITSHGASPEYGPANRLHAELDWAGTHDPSAHLAVPTAIATVGREGGGWPAIYARNHALVLALRDRLVAQLGPATPLARDDAFGTMVALPIALPANTKPFELQTRVLTDGWELPIVDIPRGPHIRLSAHLYNHASQADDLAAYLRSLGVSLR
jgi:isopenicillin-N epimerase